MPAVSRLHPIHSLFTHPEHAEASSTGRPKLGTTRLKRGSLCLFIPRLRRVCKQSEFSLCLSWTQAVCPDSTSIFSIIAHSGRLKVLRKTTGRDDPLVALTHTRRDDSIACSDRQWKRTLSSSSACGP
jgi:hypothetical protein